ncbi:hypothetical protein GDO86_008661 [Hymenochirus boettgeri]|uniref:Fucosyltransferase n=1 Tax=Hymenochirus boettgeri TaxID=247094 RepID=A0A8T2J3W0_9PIPI|nr:hypothetical protein GDO86_008661 [Hymenochirus boettgeri]
MESIKFLFLLLFQVVLSVFLFILFQDKSKKPEKNVSLYLMSEEPVITILLWTWPFGYRFILNQCPSSFDITGCFFTANRTLFLEADAVVLHQRDVCSSKDQLPQFPRPPKQYWIWFSMESPSHIVNLSFIDNLINLTMSYRADSDIFTPWGWLKKPDNAQIFSIPKKTSLVAWVISNWNPSNRRIIYYQELKKHIHVNIYGKQHLPLPRANHSDTLSKYKFYLAFENSLHEDYITEKLWYNALVLGNVPVVLGPPRQNYERFIPPDSFIHVDDFSTAQELASYLLELDKDDHKYQQYFNWRSKLQPESAIPWVSHYCKICKALKEGPNYRTIPSISRWFK